MDSRRIIYSSMRGGPMNLFWQAADGTGSVNALPKGQTDVYLTSMSPDRTQAVGMTSSSVVQTSGAGASIFVLTLAETPHIERLIQTKFITRNPQIAPDGRWLAYESNESGQFQINVRPFPNVDGGWWQVSTRGGTKPLWSPNGRELFYIDSDDFLTSVPVQTGGTFMADNPSRVLQTHYFSTTLRSYDVSRDGQKFLMIRANAGSAPPPSMVVVLNWFEELKARVRTD
jgi:Tol biopolymer transport system component